MIKKIYVDKEILLNEWALPIHICWNDDETDIKWFAIQILCFSFQFILDDGWMGSP